MGTNVQRHVPGPAKHAIMLLENATGTVMRDGQAWNATEVSVI